MSIDGRKTGHGLKIVASSNLQICPFKFGKEQRTAASSYILGIYLSTGYLLSDSMAFERLSNPLKMFILILAYVSTVTLWCTNLEPNLTSLQLKKRAQDLFACCLNQRRLHDFSNANEKRSIFWKQHFISLAPYVATPGGSPRMHGIRQ